MFFLFQLHNIQKLFSLIWGKKFSFSLVAPYRAETQNRVIGGAARSYIALPQRGFVFRPLSLEQVEDRERKPSFILIVHLFIYIM